MEKILAELVAKMTSINEQQAEIERDAALNNEGQFTDEQRASYEALAAMYDQFKAQKVKIEKDAQLMAARASREADLTFSIPSTRLTQPNSSAPANVRVRAGMPIEREDADTGETRIRFSIPRNVMRVGRPQNFHGTRDGFDAEHRAYRLGMWALAKISADMPGRYNFSQATQFVNDYMRPTNTAHMETGVVSNGQVLVPEEFDRDLIDLRETYGVARRLFGRRSMSGDTLHTPKRSGGLTAYFVNESAAGTESNMTWDDIQLVAKDLMILSRMSNQLSMDAVISIGDTLAGEIAYAFAYKEDTCAFNGDGTSTYGGMRGVRTLLDSCDGAGTNSAGLKIQGTSNTWSAQVMGDFQAVIGKLPQYADTPNTVWVCHKAYYAETMLRLLIASGGTAMNEAQVGDRRPRPMFLGYPVEFSQVFPSVTATSGVTCALGDFSLGAMFGDRQQTSIAFSEHGTVGGESVWERNQIAIRGTERFDISVHGCGDASTPGPIVGLATASAI
jgi:HK97 family phage major capsid protein